MLIMNTACIYCFGIFEAGTMHEYSCPVLHEWIHTIGKRGPRAQPLDGLTHDVPVEGCNCSRCN